MLIHCCFNGSCPWQYSINICNTCFKVYVVKFYNKCHNPSLTRILFLFQKALDLNPFSKKNRFDFNLKKFKGLGC